MTGVELIAQERDEQINKHGFTVEKDNLYYYDNQLIKAALFCLYPEVFAFPQDWDPNFAEKIKNKDIIGRLKVAGAFLAAEIDRQQYFDKLEKEDI